MALAMERLEERTGPQKVAKTLLKQLEQTKGGQRLFFGLISWPNEQFSPNENLAKKLIKKLGNRHE
jgi:hypothetical protein